MTTHSLGSNGSYAVEVDDHTPNISASIGLAGMPRGSASVLSADNQTSLTAGAAASLLNDGASMWNSFEESATNFMLNIYEKTKIHQTNWYNFTYNLVLYIYLLWTMMFLPGLADEEYNWGEYSHWIFKAANYPVSLSLNLVSYEVIIVIFCCFVLLICVYFILFFVGYRASLLANKHWKKIKLAIRIIHGFLTLTSLIYTYVFGAFIDCNYGTSVNLDGYDRPVEVLRRHPTIACSGAVNSTLISVGSIFFMLLLVIQLISVLTMSEDNPSGKNAFATDKVYYLFPFIATQCIYIILVCAIPPTYNYVKPVIYLALCILHVPYHLWLLPYFKRVENTLFFGFVGARLGGAVGFLVSSLVSTDDSNWTLGLGMMGLTIGLMLVCFVVFVVAAEIYIGILYSSIRRGVIQTIKVSVDFSQAQTVRSSIEREASGLYQKFEKDGKLRAFNLFLKFSMRSGRKAFGDFQLSDVEIALALIKGVSSQKCANNVDILITSALVVAYFLPNFTSVILAGGIVRKVAKLKSNPLKKYIITQRTKEIEFLSGEDLSGKNIMEIKNIIGRLEKKQELVLLLHKSFWKEMINESLEITKIETINRKIAELVHSCQSSYDILISNYNNEKSVIRSYARFVEDYKFDPEKAQEMYHEANIIEEEEAVNRRHQLSKTLKNKYTSNRVVPLPNQFSVASNIRGGGGGFESEDEDKGYFEKIDMNKQGHSSDSRLDDMDFENEKFEGVEENAATAQQKKEFLFRTALSSSMYNKPQFITFVVFASVSLIILTIGLILGLVFSTGVTSDIALSNDVCIPASVPLSVLMYIRKKQLHDNIKEYSMSWNTENTARVDKQCNKLSNLYSIGMNTFSESVRSDYTRGTRLLKQPVLIYSSTNTSEYTGYSTSRNSTIAEITKALVKMCSAYDNYSEERYKQTVSDYNFMFLYQNRISFSSSYESFCSEYLDRNGEKSSTYRTIFLIYYISTTALYILSAFSVIAFTRYHLTSLNDSIKLIGSSISKDKVGKIYHKLEGKVEEDLQIGSDGFFSMFVKPNNSISIMVIFMICITAICVTLFFIETIINSNNSSMAIQNIQFSVNIMMTAHRVGLRLGELFIFKSKFPSTPMNDRHLTTDDELAQFHKDNKNLASLMQSSWYSLLFGTSDNDNDKLFGKYPDIDQLIQGTCKSTSNTTSNSTTCVGLDDLVSYLTSSSALFNEDVFYASSTFNQSDLFTRMESIYSDVDLLAQKLESLIQIYSKYNSVPSITITIVFGILGYASLVTAIWFTSRSMTSFWREYQQLRMMLSYFTPEVLEENEQLKNFVLFKSLPGRLSELFKSKKSSGDTSNNEDSHVKSILEAAVDGAVLCNSQCEVTIFNPSAERSFGFKKSDIMGLPIYTLFDESSHTKMRKIISGMLAKSGNDGESIEVECVRKNQTKFPAKINIFSSKIGSDTVIVSFIKDITPEKKQNMLLEEEKKKSDSLLLNILPEAVGVRLKSGETFIAEKFNDVTCFFSDMVGFTSISSNMSPTDLVKMLNTIVNGFDSLTDTFHLEKIKTIGDAYFCVGGIHGSATSDHPERVLRFAMATFAVVHDYNLENLANKENSNPSLLNIRIGINTGSVVGGVIGTKKFAYDMWGDTINVASRMESTSLPGRIQVSRSTYERVYDMGYEFEERRIEVKGKGSTQTYMLNNMYHKNPLDANGFSNVNNVVVTASAAVSLPPQPSQGNNSTNNLNNNSMAYNNQTSNNGSGDHLEESDDDDDLRRSSNNVVVLGRNRNPPSHTSHTSSVDDILME
ncbi:predicted protein [Naegleria gruberi]|uniref:Predicted protein n=1 Tax=Naegleria gruberi TaxID=5762 RepID=D2V5J0_NAEGR|nr:uncharacterized protein NAEGRDRAFT_64095 [Naegleria gruberi]EFC47659.1 predicted protein [Naegleria gruberi]|eukprot:XP_002680403.1 predicted protein [Naegleria gruberi strain NEG-M]